MGGHRHFIIVTLLTSFIGVLGLTASEYVDCSEFYHDELLDLGLAIQYPMLPVFAPHRNTHPFLFLSLKTLCFQEVRLLTTLMRC
jgi:hypothetical protein